MPLQNRVTPASTLIAVPARGTLMGNRGVLHDARRRLTGRRCTTRAWVTCLLQFRGRCREVMTPGRYTELFFLDEATALAAGHRPCGECRRADYRRYKALWAEAAGLDARASIAVFDRILHRERMGRVRDGATHRAPWRELPDGTMVLPDTTPDAWLVLGDALLRWTPAGYTERRPRPNASRAGVAVLTPPSTVQVLAAGYRPQLHPSAREQPHNPSIRAEP